MSQPFISILMLTHNAPDYVRLSIESVRKRTDHVRFELVVLDNASDAETRDLVTDLHRKGLIDRIVLLDRNSLFAEGNNIAADNASPEATHFLLLNSDIEVKDPRWLANLLDHHSRGITSYGAAPDPDRVDGYCLLIDADLYRRYRLNTDHQWWWAVTKLQATVLTAGFSVKGFREHERYLHHFGGKSGSGFKNAKGMNVSKQEVLDWFNGTAPVLIGKPPRARRPVVRRIASRIKRILRG